MKTSQYAIILYQPYGFLSKSIKKTSTYESGFKKKAQVKNAFLNKEKCVYLSHWSSQIVQRGIAHLKVEFSRKFES